METRFLCFLMLKFLESLHLAHLFVTFYLGLDICLILETIQVTYLFYRVPLGICSDSYYFQDFLYYTLKNLHYI